MASMAKSPRKELVLMAIKEVACGPVTVRFEGNLEVMDPEAMHVVTVVGNEVTIDSPLPPTVKVIITLSLDRHAV